MRHLDLSLQWGEGFSLPELENLSERVVESSKAQPRCLYLKFCCCASEGELRKETARQLLLAGTTVL